MLFLRCLCVMTLLLLSSAEFAAAQVTNGIDGPPTNLSQQDIINMAMMSRLGGRGRSHPGGVVGPAQIMQQQQAMQQQMIMRQEAANAQLEAQKRAERKEKLRQSVQVQREKDAAKKEARKEKMLAAAEVPVKVEPILTAEVPAEKK